MAETLTSHEIEDVLSSVRRLVSEDFRPAPRTAAAAARPAMRPSSEPASRPAPEPVDRLILTASLRVTDAPAARDAGLDGEVIAPPGDELSQAAVDVEAVEEAVWTSRRSAETAYFEDIEGAARTAPSTPARGHWTAETVPNVTWSESEVDWAPEEPVPFVAHRRPGEEAAAEATNPPAATVESPAQAFRPDAAPADAADGEAAYGEALRLGAAREDAADGDDGDAPWDAATAEVAEAALTETVIEAVAEAVFTAAPRPARTAAEAAPATAMPADADAAGDVPLRDMVQQIIREELAGTLGERITRNVRKLVRIEVNRALASREFE